MAEQLCELSMGVACGIFSAAVVDMEEKWEGVDEHAEDAVRARPALHAAEEDGSEDDVCSSRECGEDLSPGEVAEACGADAEGAGLAAEPEGKFRVERERGFEDAAAVSLDLEEAEGSGGLVDIGEHAGEELFMFLSGDAEPGLGDEVAEGQG